MYDVDVPAAAGVHYRDIRGTFLNCLQHALSDVAELLKDSRLEEYPWTRLYSSNSNLLSARS